MYHVPINLKWLENEIQAYEAKPLETGKIVFYGHSLMARWSNKKFVERTLEETILGKDGSQVCLNHGFGTSTSEELLFYYDRMIRPYKPKALVVMSLANDSMYGINPNRTIENLTKLCHWARTDFPEMPIFFVKPHPHGTYTKESLQQKSVILAVGQEERFAKMLDALADSYDNVRTIRLMDKPMFYETPADVGDLTKIRKDIFADSIHLNQAGYDLFQHIFYDALDEYL